MITAELLTSYFELGLLENAIGGRLYIRQISPPPDPDDTSRGGVFSNLVPIDKPQAQHLAILTAGDLTMRWETSDKREPHTYLFQVLNREGAEIATRRIGFAPKPPEPGDMENGMLAATIRGQTMLTAATEVPLKRLEGLLDRADEQLAKERERHERELKELRASYKEELDLLRARVRDLEGERTNTIDKIIDTRKAEAHIFSATAEAQAINAERDAKIEALKHVAAGVTAQLPVLLPGLAAIMAWAFGKAPPPNLAQFTAAGIAAGGASPGLPAPKEDAAKVALGRKDLCEESIAAVRLFASRLSATEISRFVAWAWEHSRGGADLTLLLLPEHFDGAFALATSIGDEWARAEKEKATS